MRVFFVYNTLAGVHFSETEIAETIRFLQSENVEIVATKAIVGPGDGARYAAEAVAAGCDVVFLSGGDGTIAQTVEGLLYSDTSLAVLPGGTGNVVARQLNLPVAGPLHPKPMLEAARMLLAGRVCPVDVGRVTLATGARHHFVAWAGVGFDAQISRSIAAAPARKKKLGPFAFALAGFLILRDFRGTRVRFRVDGHVINRRILMLVANNIQLYGIIFRMAHHAVIDDGLLDVYGFRGEKAARALLHAIRLLVNRHIDDPAVDIYRAQRVEISSTRPLPVQTDGDYVGETPAVIEALPRSLRLLIPTTAPVKLFSAGAGQEEIRESAVDWMYRVARDVRHAIQPERY
jgi:YegS/Rv2252/BmrU family lipid kinase